MTDYRIDSHKLMFHPDRVARWLAGELVAPIYMEISPTGRCNHRCVFCGLDFMGYQARSLDADLLLERLAELADMGLKSVMYAGEGEPLLHKRFVEIAQGARKLGIDGALTTNGVLLTPDKAEGILPAMRWIKVSFNAGSPSVYAKIHGAREKDFDKAIDNLRRAVRLRETSGDACVLGMQALLLPDNQEGMADLARIARDIGLDYLVIKPYSQHPKSETDVYASINYAALDKLGAELEALSDDRFTVIFRKNAMRRWDAKDKGYERCLGLPFWSYLDAGGNVWGCSVHMTDPRFNYGNIRDMTFREIWNGRARLDNLEWAQNTMNAADCRVNCRLDEVNRYLWRLTRPQSHDNFI